MLEKYGFENIYYFKCQKSIDYLSKNLPRPMTPTNYYQRSTEHAGQAWFVDP